MSALDEKRAKLQAVIEARKGGKAPGSTAFATESEKPVTAEILPMRPGAGDVAAQLAEVKKDTDADQLQAALDAENREFFVSVEGGKTGIFRETIDPEMGRWLLVAMSQSEYRLLQANRFVQTTDGKGNTKTAGLAEVWLRHRDRRQYLNGLALLPGQDTPEGVYNLWRGFGVEPTKGDVKPALQHVRNILCKGDDMIFKYVVGWLAFAVQHPGEPAEVAIVMRGGRGTGKSTVLRWMVDIFGGHALHILHTRHLTGNFNAHWVFRSIVTAHSGLS